MKVKLGDVCEILDYKRVPITASKRNIGIYPYYGANGIQDYVDKYIFDDELVLLAEDGGNFGSNTKPIAYRVSGKCWVNNHAHVLKPKNNINVDFLCYSLMFYDVSRLINGATRQKLTQSDMKKIIIELPTKSIQNIIVAQLKKIDCLIALRKQQLEKLDLLVKSKFIEMFGTIDNNINNFPIMKLEDLCEKITDGKHGGCSFEDNTGFYFVGAREIYNDEVHYCGAPQIPESEFIKDYMRCDLQNGDLVIVNTGATIGKSAIIDSPFASHILLQKSVALLRTKKDILFPLFLKYCYSVNPEMYRVKNASAQPNLLLSSIRATSIIVPPIELQNKFVAIAKQSDKSKFSIKQSLEKLETLKKALMQKYFG